MTFKQSKFTKVFSFNYLHSWTLGTNPISHKWGIKISCIQGSACETVKVLKINKNFKKRPDSFQELCLCSIVSPHCPFPTVSHGLDGCSLVGA